MKRFKFRLAILAVVVAIGSAFTTSSALPGDKYVYTGGAWANRGQEILDASLCRGQDVPCIGVETANGLVVTVVGGGPYGL